MTENKFKKLLAEQVQSLIPLCKSEEKKYSEIVKLLLSTDFELRGKVNSDLQLSASAIVFKGNEIFFIEHPYQKEWLLPAGHVELEEEPLETAIREFHEETGFFAQKEGKLIDVNLIEIPYNQAKNEKAHRHIDFRFLLKLDKKNGESAELPFKLMSKAEAPAEFQKYFYALDSR